MKSNDDGLEFWKLVRYTCAAAIQMHREFLMHDDWDSEMDEESRQNTIENQNSYKKAYAIVSQIIEDIEEGKND